MRKVFFIIGYPIKMISSLAVYVVITIMLIFVWPIFIAVRIEHNSVYCLDDTEKMGVALLTIINIAFIAYIVFLISR